jgi:hypothetical protein
MRSKRGERQERIIFMGARSAWQPLTFCDTYNGVSKIATASLPAMASQWMAGRIGRVTGRPLGRNRL